MFTSKKLSRLVQIMLIASCSGLMVAPMVFQSAYAKEEKKEQVSSKVGKPLKQARDLMDQKKWKEALDKTKEAAAIEGKNATEDAIINEMLAYSMINLKDYKSAVAVYESMLVKGQFKKEDEPKRILNMSQIYFALQNYPKSIELGERYLKSVGGNDAEVLRQIAQAYYLQNNFSKSEVYTNRLISLAQKQGKPLQEDWLKLLMSSQHKQNKKSDVVATLEKLLETYPNQQYWSDMFTYMLQGTSFSDRQNIMYLRLVHQAGLLQPDEYIEMAELSLATANPGDAKTILEEAMAKGFIGKGESKDRDAKLLSMAKSQSVEDLHALPSIEKEAIAKPTGDPLIRVGEAYLGHGLYENAIAAFTKGLAKGSVTNPDDAKINLGIAYMGVKKSHDAINTFKSIPATSRLALMSRLWRIQATNIQ